MKKNYNFTEDWISGFTQSDGSFVVSFLNQSKGVPIRPQPIFNLSQSIVDLEMFTGLQQYLGVGKIYKNRQNVSLLPRPPHYWWISSGGDIVPFRGGKDGLVVKSIYEIVNVILPLFDLHPVRGGKFLAYNIFKEVSLMVKNKEHLTVEGTLKILDLAYYMNKASPPFPSTTYSSVVGGGGGWGEMKKLKN